MLSDIALPREVEQVTEEARSTMLVVLKLHVIIAQHGSAGAAARCFAGTVGDRRCAGLVRTAYIGRKPARGYADCRGSPRRYVTAPQKRAPGPGPQLGETMTLLSASPCNAEGR